MSISCGFYNSLNGDRRYGSPQMSALFDGVINDGVFMNVGGALMTTPGTGMSVVVAPGRAWFERTWTYNDSDYPLTISPSEVVLNRIDAIVLETNSSDEVRNNTIKVIKGVPNANAMKPELTNSDLIHQHALAYVTVKAGVTEITEADIEIMVGKTECPFVTAILETTDITALMNQWQAQFDAWFANVEYTLSGDAAGKLQVQIDSFRRDFDEYTPYQIGDVKISSLINSDPNWALCNGEKIDSDKYPELFEKTNNIKFNAMQLAEDFAATYPWENGLSYQTILSRVQYDNGKYYFLVRLAPASSSTSTSLAIMYTSDFQSWDAVQFTNTFTNMQYHDFCVHSDQALIIGRNQSADSEMIWGVLSIQNKQLANSGNALQVDTSHTVNVGFVGFAYGRWVFIYQKSSTSSARIYITNTENVNDAFTSNYTVRNTITGNPFSIDVMYVNEETYAIMRSYNNYTLAKIGLNEDTTLATIASGSSIVLSYGVGLTGLYYNDTLYFGFVERAGTDYQLILYEYGPLSNSPKASSHSFRRFSGIPSTEHFDFTFQGITRIGNEIYLATSITYAAPYEFTGKIILIPMLLNTGDWYIDTGVSTVSSFGRCIYLNSKIPNDGEFLNSMILHTTPGLPKVKGVLAEKCLPLIVYDGAYAYIKIS